MLQHARGDNLCKPHILKFKPRKKFVDDVSPHAQDMVKWCNSHISFLESNLKEKGVLVDVTAIPIVPGVYLSQPQHRDELRVIKSNYDARVFEGKDTAYEQLVLVRNALQIYRNTKREYYKWMDDVDKELASLVEAKSYEQQAARELAPLSGSFVPIWIKWDLKALDMVDKTKPTDLEEFLSKNGLLADVPVIQPLKYDLCEILVKDDRTDKIKLLLAGRMYEEFDEESTLVSVCGYMGSLSIVLTSYKNNTGTWAGQMVNNRIEELEEKAKGRMKESGDSSKI